MKKKILKIFLSVLVLVILIYVLIFFLSPLSIVDIYRGSDETTIWVKIKHFPIKKEISGTTSYKAPDLKWSPDKNLLVFGDATREKIYDKEWELKVINLRNFSIRTFFVGDYRTSRYDWIDNKIVRVYLSAGSGVSIYRDVNVDAQEPFIVADHTSSEYWILEKNSTVEN